MLAIPPNSSRVRPVMEHQIRNFSIVAHIDHGKSTLADRMIEMTDTVEKRRMRDQILDSMELERERGITIKMQPVSLRHIPKTGAYAGAECVLNVIDTPGHIDFAYEVSRALKAVEGVVLLVDATQGVQAQTLSTLELVRELGLTIVPVLSKIDSPLARVDEVKLEVSELIECDVDDILETSGKTGAGVDVLLDAIVERIPAPGNPYGEDDGIARGLIYDFEYSNHRGVIVYIRMMTGQVKAGEKLIFKNTNKTFGAGEVGVFSPEKIPVETLSAGEIGYIVTGIKQPGVASVGDTVAQPSDTKDPLSGYRTPQPVVWASIYPESQDDFSELTQALDRLRLSDASLSYEEEASDVLGRGYRCGFLGMLHLEIITERIRREFDLDIIITTPSITYEIQFKDGTRQTIYTPAHFPDDAAGHKHGGLDHIEEPWIVMSIIAPEDLSGVLLPVLYDHEAVMGDTENFGSNRMQLKAYMPLRELMRGFFDRIKSVSQGFASVSYELADMREADVVRLDVLVADEPVPAFTRITARHRAQKEAEHMVERLHTLLPRQQFAANIQVKGLGRVLSAKKLPAMRKDVTAKLYGGDRTRKMKLLQKQKKGKKKLASQSRVNIPQDVFLKMMRSEE